MKRRQIARYLTIIILCCGLLWLYFRNGNVESDSRRTGILNRQLTPLIYTRHARCRMGCRHIDESEIREILQKGEINYKRSDLRATPDPKYALEGVTHDNQLVRIIFAPSTRGMVVITCIDLNQEWQCNCN
ncbi:MAG TPA: DUF4258 domain-containing protein [Agriterribacter sp.]|nr:DUF4258 domain-containing protein [Agriterribacter sp.]